MICKNRFRSNNIEVWPWITQKAKSTITAPTNKKMRSHWEIVAELDKIRSIQVDKMPIS